MCASVRDREGAEEGSRAGTQPRCHRRRRCLAYGFSLPPIFHPGVCVLSVHFLILFPPLSLPSRHPKLAVQWSVCCTVYCTVEDSEATNLQYKIIKFSFREAAF